MKEIETDIIKPARYVARWLAHTIISIINSVIYTIFTYRKGDDETLNQEKYQKSDYST